MARWYILTSLLVLTVAMPRSATAQTAPAPYSSPSPYGAAGESTGEGVVPAGWHSSHGWGGYGPGYGNPVPAGYGPPAPLASGPGRTTYYQLPGNPYPLPPKDDGIYDPTPVEVFLANTFRHGAFRLEYLLWDISPPGNNNFGSATNFPAAVANPLTGPLREPNPFVYDVTIPGNVNNILVVNPTFSGVDIAENNGIRGTWAMPFTGGTLEASAFALNTSGIDIPIFQDQQVDTNDIDGDGNLFESVNIIQGVAIPTLINGVVPAGQNFIIFDAGYEATLNTSLWGAEANWFVEPFNPNHPFQIEPLVGFRFLNFNEEFLQRGQYNVTTADPVTGLPVTVQQGGRIDAKTFNYLYGPQIGMRARATSRYATLSVTPKAMLGLNSYQSRVETESLISATDPALLLRERNVTFGVVADLQVATEFHLRENVTIFAAYNLMFAGLVTRPYDNIIYNQPAFNQDVQFGGILVQGLSVGGQISY